MRIFFILLTKFYIIYAVSSPNKKVNINLQGPVWEQPFPKRNLTIIENVAIEKHAKDLQNIGRDSTVE